MTEKEAFTYIDNIIGNYICNRCVCKLCDDCQLHEAALTVLDYLDNSQTAKVAKKKTVNKKLS